MSQAGGGEVHEHEECGEGDGGVSGVGEVSEMSDGTRIGRTGRINADVCPQVTQINTN